jgi:predicted GNAT family acetyltransferase
MTEVNTTRDEIRVVDNPDASQFEARIDGHLAFVSYARRGDLIILTHTEVPKELQGRGIGNILAHAVLERARTERWKVVARCPFIAKYIVRHPEYQSLVYEP